MIGHNGNYDPNIKESGVEDVQCSPYTEKSGNGEIIRFDRGNTMAR